MSRSSHRHSSSPRHASSADLSRTIGTFTVSAASSKESVGSALAKGAGLGALGLILAISLAFFAAWIAWQVFKVTLTVLAAVIPAVLGGVFAFLTH